MKEYTQADWDEYAEWAAEAAKAPYEELDAPWIVVNRGPDDIHPARSNSRKCVSNTEQHSS